jgi:hypothetical protein
MEQEFTFESDDEKQIELTAQYGVLWLQIALICKRHALAGDIEALNFFEDTFKEIIGAARQTLRRKLQ